MNEREAWAAYWRGAPGSGCLSGAPADVTRRLQEGWRAFAKKLARDARLLDLATGTGAVLELIRHERPDLYLLGVDYASPSTNRGRVEVIGGVDCASLPFEDATFDAVSSQFGVEYCTADAIDEAVRVLRPGGLLRFVAHHAGSPVVRHNAARAAALSALRDAGLFVLGRRIAAGLPADSKLQSSVASAQRQHGSQRVAAELPAAVRQALGSPQPTQHIADLERRAAAEIGRLRAMQAAALDEATAGSLVDKLEGVGVTATTHIIAEQGQTPIAWVISGSRR